MAELAYESWGSGRETVVLVHGFPLTAAMWRAQLPALGTGAWRAVAPDLRGFGRTPGAIASVDEAADDLLALIDALGADRVVLGGFSMGGYIALAFMRRHAARVRGLMLVDTKAEADGAEAKKGRYALADRVRSEGKGIVIEAMLPRLVADATLSGRPDVVQAVLDVEGGATQEGIIGALKAMAERPDSSGDLSAIVCPALVIVGHDDVITPVADAERMAGTIPDVKLVVIPDAGHLSPMEHPAAVNAAMTEWLARL